MKRLISRGALLLGLLAALALAGCDFLTGLVDPLIGSWVYSPAGSPATMTVTYTFHADNTFEIVLSQTGAPDRSVTGIYTHDPDEGTLTMSALTGGTGTVDFSYSISSDRKTLTLWGQGSSLDLTRK